MQSAGAIPRSRRAYFCTKGTLPSPRGIVGVLGNLQPRRNRAHAQLDTPSIKSAAYIQATRAQSQVPFGTVVGSRDEPNGCSISTPCGTKRKRIGTRMTPIRLARAGPSNRYQ